MKRSLLSSFAILIACTLAAGSLNAASERENKRLAEGKITKNQAQHLVIKKYPGATIKSCVLVDGKDHGIWLVEFKRAGSEDITKVQVDGRTGKILP